MQTNGFADLKTSGDQGRALWMSTLAFTVCFAVWTIFSIIGIRIKDELGLSETEFGLLVGTPILTGSLSRIFLGIWTDRYGGRLVFTLTMLATSVATVLLAFAHTYPQMLLAALGVGLAGGSFAVGVAYVSRFFPQGRQGTALGIFGVGNVGAAVTKFAAPFVLLAWGWQAVALAWAAVLAVMAVVFWLTTFDDPVLVERRKTGAAPKPFLLELSALRDVRVWRFAFYYFFVFGAFVALALWLPRYLIGVYGFDIATAGMIGAPLLDPRQHLPRLRRRALRPRRRAHRHVLEPRRLGGGDARPVAAADDLRSARHQGRHRLTPRARRRRLHRRRLRARLLHEPRQGRRLQAHRHVLPQQRRRGRRPRRHDRRPRRVRAADRLRRAQRSHRPVVELLHAAVRHRRRRRWCGWTSPSAACSAATVLRRRAIPASPSPTQPSNGERYRT